MRFHVLGPFRVLDGDENLSLGSPQQQKVLAVLCTTPNEAVSSDRLIDEIWGETPPPSAHHLIQVYVSRLRAVLGDFDGGRRITRTGTGYVLRTLPNEVDAYRMEALTEQALTMTEDNSDKRWALLHEATEIWNGKPFEDLSDDSITLKAESTRLTETYLNALEGRVEIDLRRGRHLQVIGELDQLRSEHPYRERIWELLMLALYRSGRQAEALRSFQTLRRVLGDDLGIEPTPSIVELEGRILLQDPELDWEPQPPPSNVPLIATTFVGRGSEMAEISKLLEVHRLVTLTGPGGIGKTRLAGETAQRTLFRFEHGTWWIDLAHVSDPDEIATEAARILGLSAQPAKSITESIVQSLVRREALLVFDNCEHLAPAVADLAAAILCAASQVRILATSRTPLHITGEALWTVPALAMPLDDSTSTSELAHADAIRLFVERGAMISPRFELNKSNAAAVVEICRRLDGLPLGIEMAAARLRVLSPGEIAASLGNRFSLLKRAEHDVSPRHETLQAAIDWSYGLLQPHLQIAFASLAVFPGSFDLNAAAGVALSDTRDTDAVDVMTDLVESSMITRIGDTNSAARFRLLETLRVYGTQRLRERGLLERLLDSHAGYFLGLVERAGHDSGQPAFAHWMGVLTDSYDDIQQALGWSLEHHTAETTLRVAPALQHYWFRTGDARGAHRWGLLMADNSAVVPPALAGAAHAAVSFGATILADPTDAIEHADRAIEFCEHSQDRQGLVTALFGRANAALMVGDFDKLRRMSFECLSICDEIGYPWGRAGALSMLSFAEFFGGGSLSEGRALAEEAVSLFRELGDVASQTVMNPLSAIALQQGDVKTAERYALETAGIAQDSSWEATALVNLAEVYLAKGDLDRADAMLRRGVTRALDTGLENWFRMGLRDLAQVAAHRGESERAATLLGASRRNMPSWGLDPAVYESVSAKCLRSLGDRAFKAASDAGHRSDIEQLLDLVFD